MADDFSGMAFLILRASGFITDFIGLALSLALAKARALDWQYTFGILALQAGIIY